MSSSTGSRPTTSRSVPHSSQDTISPLSVSKSTWTSASHSGQVPVGTCFLPPPQLSKGSATPLRRGNTTTLYGNRVNLPASAGICNLLFFRAAWSNSAVTKAVSFCFFCKDFDRRTVLSGTTTVGFHNRRNRNQPRQRKGLTGPDAVTNILCVTCRHTYNGAHVGTDKQIAPPVGPVTCLSAAAGADRF